MENYNETIMAANSAYEFPIEQTMIDAVVDAPQESVVTCDTDELTKHSSVKVPISQEMYTLEDSSLAALGLEPLKFRPRKNSYNRKSKYENSEQMDLQSSQHHEVQLSKNRKNNDMLTSASLFELIAITCFNFPYGFICGTFGLWLLPAEATRLYPNKQSLVLGLSLGIVGITQLVCPVAGKISDKYQSNSQFGKRRPYIIWGCVVAIVATIGMFTASKMYLGVLYYFFLFLGMSGLNVVYSVQCGLVPDVLDEELQGRSSGLVAVHTLLGSGVGFALIIGTSQKDFHFSYGLYIALTIVSCFLVCRTASFLEVRKTLQSQYRNMACHKVSENSQRERSFEKRKNASVNNRRLENICLLASTPTTHAEDGEEKKVSKTESQIPINMSTSDNENEHTDNQILKQESENQFSYIMNSSVRSFSLQSKHTNPVTKCSIENEKFTLNDLKKAFFIDTSDGYDFFWVFIGRALYYLGVSVQAFMVYYLRDVIKTPTEAQRQFQIGCIALIAQLTAAFVAYPVGLYTDRHPEMGKKPMIFLACGIMATVYLGFLFAPVFEPYSIYFVMLIAVVYGAGNGCFLAVDYALALATLPNKEDTTHALGIWGVSAFIGSSLGPLLWGIAIEIFGKDPQTQFYRFSGYVAIMLGGLIATFLSGAVIGLIRRVA